MKLVIEPLSKQAFSDFGDVIETTDSEHFLINNGSTQRFHDLAKIDMGEEGRMLVNIFRATPRSYPLTIEMVERHPLGSQAFMPLGSNPYLVLVAPKGEAVSPEDLRLFSAAADQGVHYHAGTWHHPVLALGGVSDFLVIDRGGDEHNCDEIFFDTDDIRIEL
ncbi:MAG: ureidoglycolate lyase [Sneathiella sp.]|nr:MAG: ureidoglycolate lyase [Sneathiella sp.]